MSEVARLPRREADGQDDLSLPGWVYRDPDYFRVEMARLIRPSWQIVCHANDIPNAGDWRTLDILGESVIVIRGGDGLVARLRQRLPPSRLAAGRRDRRAARNG